MAGFISDYVNLCLLKLKEKTMLIMWKRLLASGVALGTFLVTTSADASGPLADPSRSTCTTVNCSSETITGYTTNGNFGVNGPYPTPWVGVIGPSGGECLRIQTTQQQGDLEIVVVAADGRVFRNDDSGGTDLSLVKITPTIRGPYTVQVSHFNGAPVSATFVLRYGVYLPATNPNCANPTAPALSGQEVRK
jgi:hypothetical protein